MEEERLTVYPTQVCCWHCSRRRSEKQRGSWWSQEGTTAAVADDGWVGFHSQSQVEGDMRRRRMAGKKGIVVGAVGPGRDIRTDNPT